MAGVKFPPLPLTFIVALTTLALPCERVIIYTADLASIVAEHDLSLHHYAHDSQIYGSYQSDATPSLSNTVSQCVDSISNWMRSNRLQHNADKTEVM